MSSKTPFAMPSMIAIPSSSSISLETLIDQRKIELELSTGHEALTMMNSPPLGGKLTILNPTVPRPQDSLVKVVVNIP